MREKTSRGWVKDMQLMDMSLGRAVGLLLLLQACCFHCRAVACTVTDLPAAEHAIVESKKWADVNIFIDSLISNMAQASQCHLMMVPFHDATCRCF